MPTPYSNNIYSTGNVSDDETDALSPTDGYFHTASQHNEDSSSLSSPSSTNRLHHSIPRIPRRSSALVEDPTLFDSTAKAREAQAESHKLNKHESRPHQLHSPLHRHHPRRGGEHHNSQYSHHTQPQHPADAHSPLFSHLREAPPAYTPSPSTSGYHTFGPSNSTMGLPEEQQRLIPHPPESMGGLGPVGASDPSRWQRIKDSVTESVSSKKLKTLLGILAVLAVVAMFSSFTGYRSYKQPNFDKGTPIGSPDMDDSRDEFTWKPLPNCRNNHLVRVDKSFDTPWDSDHNLEIVQKIERNGRTGHRRSPSVSGEAIVVPTDSSSGRVDIQVITNDESINVPIDTSADGQKLTVTTPAFVAWDSGYEGPCVQIRITVWAPKEATLDSLSILTTQLDIKIKQDVNIEVLRGLSLRSVSGDVRTPAISAKEDLKSAVAPYKLSTREIRISTTSGEIKGWFPLFDVLAINSVSGDVGVDVTPKPADPKVVRPAVLHVYSTSGDVKVVEQVDFSSVTADDLPDRDYTVELATASGSITAKVAASSFAQAKSQSGRLDIVLLPVLDAKLLSKDGHAFYHTETTSSSTKFTILEPIWTGKDDKTSSPAFGILTSKHHSVSGHISLAYPGSWEGRLAASTTSGSQHVSGEGLEVDSRTDRPWSKHLLAHKGEGRSKLEVETVSGDQDILIGN